MYNDIDPNTRTDNVQQKPIFASNVYKTNHQQRNPLQNQTANNFKSASLSACLSQDPEVLYFNEKLFRPKKKSKKVVRECSTQTSKTILQLARMDSGQMSPDSLAGSPRDFSNNVSMQNYPYSVANHLSDYTLDGSCHEQDCLFHTKKTLDKPLTQTFLEKNRTRIPQKPELITCFKREDFRSRSFDDTFPHPNYIQESAIKLKPVISPRRKPTRRSCKSLDLPDNSFISHKSSSSYFHQNTFMCPTTASRIKSKLEEIQSTNYLIPPMRRGRSTSPKPSGDYKRLDSLRRIPYIDQSKSDFGSSTTLINATRYPERLLLRGLDEDLSKSELSLKFSEDLMGLVTNLEPSNSTVDNTMCMAVSKLRDPDWRVALRGLAEIVEICRVIDVDLIHDYMTTINQRVIELLKSQRSHVCRTACQAAGHLFEYVKDTRRPEFDDIVDILLQKTADSNKFIRQHANLALDCMVTHISTFNAARALCNKGPGHKNPLVRSATVRLLVCAMVIAGPESVFNPNNNEFTRKRFILNMARFLEDRNLETRRLAERLYKVMCRESRFDIYLRKYLDKDQIVKIKRTLRLVHKK